MRSTHDLHGIANALGQLGHIRGTQSTMGPMSDLSALNLEAGSLVGGYTLISRLGSGAMGSVWRVRDDGGHQYAMKILRDSLSEGDSDAMSREHITARERLRREAMALQKVRHPGVCAIVDMELDDALAFIVTELIEGKNLREDVRVNGRYTGDDLERLARKLIEAVEAVHAAGIVHRDIKPTNVMVSVSGPVLVDFGIAMGEGESHVTSTGLVMGTPGFIAPEVIDGAESDDMTDWWSVASVLAFAATGEPVFGTKPMMAVLERAAAGSANLTGLPAGTLAAFRSALSPRRENRCTPKELLHAISVDALNPQLWSDASTSAETEMMPPFDEGRVENPRTLWRFQDGVTGEDAINTRTMPRFIEPTKTIDPTTVKTTVNKTREFPAIASASGEVSGSTRAMPQFTQVMPVQDTPTQGTPVPEVKPALRRISTQLPPTINPQDSASQQPSEEPRSATEPQSAAERQSSDARTHPNPTYVRRGELLDRGTLPCVLLGVVIAVCGLFSPWMALLTSLVLFWLLFTVGFNTESQLEREERRGSGRKASDVAIRVASLPWHMVKGLGYALLRSLIMLGVTALGLTIATLALNLPFAIMDTDVFGVIVPLPTLTEGPFSQSGLAQAGFCAVGWLVSMLGSGALVMRLGAGAIRGARK